MPVSGNRTGTGILNLITTDTATPAVHCGTLMIMSCIRLHSFGVDTW